MYARWDPRSVILSILQLKNVITVIQNFWTNPHVDLLASPTVKATYLAPPHRLVVLPLRRLRRHAREVLPQVVHLFIDVKDHDLG